MIFMQDLCDRVRNMAELFDFERVEKGNIIRYIRYGVQYVPISSTRLKKQRRVSAAPEEIKRFNDTYIKSRAAAKILGMTHSAFCKKINEYTIKTLDADSCKYYSQNDINKLKEGMLLKTDDYLFLDRCNDIKFRLIKDNDSYRFVGCKDKVEIGFDLIIKSGDVETITDQERFLHFPRKKPTYDHFLIGNRGSIVNVSLGHIFRQPQTDSYLLTTINGNNDYWHRFVGEIWLPNLKKKPEIHHINRIKSDERACNLVWVTDAEHRQCHKLLKELDKATDKASRAAARQTYRAYIQQLKVDNAKAD